MYDIKTTSTSKSLNILSKGVSLIPTEYDLRDYIKIPVKDQGMLSTCWAFTSNTSLETNILLKRALTYDFSEKYIDYFTARGPFLDGINTRRI